MIEINIANLAGVPSIIYGLLGLGLFVRMMAMGRSVLAGACTLGTARPAGRHHLDARGAARRAQVAPRSIVRAGRDQVADDLASGAAGGVSGILTGLILALSRAIGETAPLITIGALTVHSVRALGRLLALHGSSDPDLQLGLAAAGRLRRERGGGHRRPARAAADDERGRDRAARPVPEAIVINDIHCKAR